MLATKVEIVGTVSMNFHGGNIAYDREVPCCGGFTFIPATLILSSIYHQMNRHIFYSINHHVSRHTFSHFACSSYMLPFPLSQVHLLPTCCPFPSARSTAKSASHRGRLPENQLSGFQPAMQMAKILC